MDKKEPVAWLWECLGRWSAYLATNGTQADCAPPDYLVEAVKAATVPPSKPFVFLTKEDMPSGDHPMYDTKEFYAGMAWAQTRLKEKNR